MSTLTWVGHSVLLYDLSSGPWTFENEANVLWPEADIFPLSLVLVHRAGHIHRSPPSESVVLGLSQWVALNDLRVKHVGVRDASGTSPASLVGMRVAGEMTQRQTGRQVSAPRLILQRRNKHCIYISQLLPKTLAFESVNVNILPWVWRRRCCCYYVPTVNFPWAEFSMCTVLLLRSTNSWLHSSLKQRQMFQLCTNMCMCFYCVITLSLLMATFGLPQR